MSYKFILLLLLLISQISACSSYRHKKWDKKFMDMDQNSDGKISKSEWNSMHKDKFMDLDLDKDGFLSKEEFKKKKKKKMNY